MAFWKCFGLGISATAICFSAVAAPAEGLSLTDTRLIMDDGRTAVATIFDNASQTMFLARAKVTAFDGHPAETNFIITPPVAFCPPGKQTRFQIALIHPERYPTDRESLFYFETHAAPGAYDNTTNSLDISYAFRIKLFYRPEGIDDNITDASENLTWTLEHGILKVTNPSRLHVTLVTVGIEKAFQKLQDGVLPPGSTREFRLKHQYPEKVLIRWAAIDDFGSVLQMRRTIKNEQ